jgi:hypothetical protein
MASLLGIAALLKFPKPNICSLCSPDLGISFAIFIQKRTQSAKQNDKLFYLITIYR